MINKNKKGISPVVATALLLVVAVVAVVGFQTWFATYNSSNMVKVEQQSNSGSGVTAERLENRTVYLKNTGETIIPGDVTKGVVNLASDGSQVGTINIDIVGALTGLNNYTVSADTVKGTAYEVIIYTASGVYTTHIIGK